MFTKYNYRVKENNVRYKLVLASLTFVCLCLGSTITGRAETIAFTDRAAFAAASANLTTISFEGIAPPGGFVFFGSPGSLALGGVTFSTPNALFVQNRNFYGTGAFLSAQQGSPPVVLNVSLPSNTTAVGTDYFSATAVAITLSTGEVFTVSGLSFPTLGFVGFTSDVAITSLRFTTTTGIDLDNVAFGQRVGAPTDPVPEPTTLILLATGLGGVGAKVRRRHKV